MISFTEVLIKAKCGELDWLCCLSEEQLIELRGYLAGMDNADARTFYKMVCVCKPGGGTPPKGGNGGVTAATCIKEFLTKVCTPENKKYIDEAQAALIIAIAIPAVPSWVSAILKALLAAVEALELACNHQDLTEGAMKALCDTFVSYEDKFNELPDVVKSVLVTVSPLTGPLAIIIAALKKCCAEVG